MQATHPALAAALAIVAAEVPALKVETKKNQATTKVLVAALEQVAEVVETRVLQPPRC